MCCQPESAFLRMRVQAFEETQRRITSTLGVPSIADLQRQPAVAAKLLAAHVVVGQSVPFEQVTWREPQCISAGLRALAGRLLALRLAWYHVCRAAQERPQVQERRGQHADRLHRVHLRRLSQGPNQHSARLGHPGPERHPRCQVRCGDVLHGVAPCEGRRQASAATIKSQHHAGCTVLLPLRLLLLRRGLIHKVNQVIVPRR